MVEITIGLNCPDQEKTRARYILDLISSISSIKFKLVDSNPQISYGAGGENHELHIPHIEYEFKDDEWSLASSRTRLIVPGFIQRESLGVTDRKLGIDFFSLAYRFLTLSLADNGKLNLSPAKIKTNLRHVYPFFNSYVDLFIDSLKAAKILPAGFNRISPWPGLAPFAVGLSHDLDIYRRKVIGGLIMLSKSIFTGAVPGGFSGSLKGLADTLAALILFRKNPYRQLPQWQDSDYKSTLFLFTGKRNSANDPTYKVERVAKELLSDSNYNFEIAYHNGIGTWGNPELLRENAAGLARLFSSNIPGIRPHYLDCELPSFWKNADCFEYSSSIGSDSMPGFVSGLNHPFFGFDFSTGRRLDILELPIGVMDCALFTIKDDILRERTVDDIIANCVSHSGLLVLDWHVRTAYKPDFPGWYDLYEMILAKAKSHGAYIASLDEINRHWRKHCESVFSS